MGIDPIRFLKEFVGHVYHVHGKDTMIIEESLYQYGNLQEATFAKPYKYGGMNWRYTIPGHGVSDWKIILNILKDSGYAGCISIELKTTITTTANTIRNWVCCRVSSSSPVPDCHIRHSVCFVGAIHWGARRMCEIDTN